LSPNNPLITDPINGFLPPHFYLSHHHFRQSIHSGVLNLWFPQNFCGVPFTFYSYPLSYILFAIFKIPTAHDILLFIHILGAGIFAYLYLKKIKLKILPALIGAISWMFNGYVMVWFEFEHVPMLAMTLPAILFFIELWWDRQSGIRFVGLTCAISLSICTAYAHLIIYQMLFVGCYFIFKIFYRIRNKDASFRSRAKPIAGILIAIILSMIISMNVFISHISLLKTGQRKHIPYSDLFKVTGQLPVKYLTTMLFPDLFGSPASKTSFTLRSFTPKTDKRQVYNNYNELCIYVGILSLFLALTSFLYFRENKYIGIFGCNAILCLLMAMGCIIYYPLAAVIPGLNLSTPTRILYLFGFSMSMLSGLGAQVILKNEMKSRKLILALWSIILLTSVLLIIFLQTDEGIRWTTGAYALNQWEKMGLSNIIHSYYKINSFIMLKPVLVILTTFTILVTLTYANTEKHKSIILLIGIIL